MTAIQLFHAFPFYRDGIQTFQYRCRFPSDYSSSGVGSATSPDYTSRGFAKIDSGPVTCHEMSHLCHIYIYNIYIYIGKLWRPHCDLTGIMVNKGNHPKFALIQVSELLSFAQYIYIILYYNIYIYMFVHILFKYVSHFKESAWCQWMFMDFPWFQIWSKMLPTRWIHPDPASRRLEPGRFLCAQARKPHGSSQILEICTNKTNKYTTRIEQLITTYNN